MERRELFKEHPAFRTAIAEAENREIFRERIASEPSRTGMFAYIDRTVLVLMIAAGMILVAAVRERCVEKH